MYSVKGSFTKSDVGDLIAQLQTGARVYWRQVYDSRLGDHSYTHWSTTYEVYLKLPDGTEKVVGEKGRRPGYAWHSAMLDALDIARSIRALEQDLKNGDRVFFHGVSGRTGSIVKMPETPEKPEELREPLKACVLVDKCEFFPASEEEWQLQDIRLV